MRLAVFIKRTIFHEGYGGLETQNKVLCEELAKKGFNITVFSPQWELRLTEKKENNINYIFVPSKYLTLFEVFCKNSWFKKSLQTFEKFHDKNPFDLVLSQSSAGLGVIREKRRLNVRVVTVAHGSIISEIKTRLLNLPKIAGYSKLLKDIIFSLYVFFRRQRHFIHGSDLVICVSNYVKRALIEETFASDAKFRVIYNGVDFSAFPQNPTKADLGILFVGRIEIEKGIKTLFSIFSSDNFSNTPVDIVGGGTLLEDFKSWVKKAELSRRFKIHGKIPHKDLLGMYSPNKLFVFPTNRIEGFPMVLSEAMYGGSPVVAFDLGGVSDAVRHGETGFLVKQGDIAEFKERVKELLENSDLREKFSKNAKKVAREELSIDVMINKYLEVFKEVLS